MSCRSRAWAVAIALALVTVSGALPVAPANSCIEDVQMRSLLENEPNADLFCEGFAQWELPSVTNTIVGRFQTTQKTRVD